MASALSRTAWTMTSTSRLVIERIDPRSSRSARPISSSLVVMCGPFCDACDRAPAAERPRPACVAGERLSNRADGGRCALLTVGLGHIVVALAVACLAAQDQRVTNDGDGGEDEPLDRVAEMRALVENG